MATQDKKAAVISPQLQAAMDRMHKADTDVDSYPKWDFDKYPILEGVVVKVKHTTQIRRGEDVDVRLAVVEADSGLYLLWESANLSEFFNEISIGSEILVSYKEEVALSGKKRMKVYDAFYS